MYHNKLYDKQFLSCESIKFSKMAAIGRGHPSWDLRYNWCPWKWPYGKCTSKETLFCTLNMFTITLIHKCFLIVQKVGICVYQMLW